MSVSLNAVTDWSNLLRAYRQAAKGKRGETTIARFDVGLADRLLCLQKVLKAGQWCPGPYVHFHIHEPKRRLISAAPFADRVVHHALCNVIEPLFEPVFLPTSYANRPGKGTHRAVDRLQTLARHHQYCLRMDIVKHFPSMDHEVLISALETKVKDPWVLELIGRILVGGADIPHQPPVQLFPGDDLLDLARPRGLPIGNLTSQFWSNVYLHALDLFVQRELGCRAYVRYVDDFVLFSDSKKTLWAWKQAVIQRLERLRLRAHETCAQVVPTRCGIPWLGFVVYPDHRRVKRRKVVQARRRLGERFTAWQEGRISFGEFDASVQGWINHVRYADTWELRKSVLKPFRW